MGIFLNTITALIDPIAAIMMIFILVSERNRLFSPMGYRFALALAICGLVGQAAWSGFVLLFGSNPTINSMPWWIGKDLGYFLFSMTYVIRHLKNDADYQKIREEAETRKEVKRLRKLARESASSE